MKFKIPLSQPNLNRDDFLQIKECFDSSWISSKSPWVDKFEKEFACQVSQTKYAVAVNSGTSALFLALKSLGIGQGDEVILPTLTMIATVNAVVWAGAKPILVDSNNHKDWNMNLTQLKQKINKSTKAIIPVHLYGYPVDMNRLMAIAKERKVFVVEDAAEAMGSIYQHKAVGSWGDLSCYSLYSNKIITTGNGGMIATNSKHLYLLLKQISFFDFHQENHFLHHQMGYNLVLSGLQSALGYSQVRRFRSLLNHRQKIYFWYRQYLHKHVDFIFPRVETIPNYWFPAIIFRSRQNKQKVMKTLNDSAVETREFFLPVHLQPLYKNVFKNEKYIIAEYFYNHGLLLPSYFELKQNQIKYICEVIKTTLRLKDD